MSKDGTQERLDWQFLPLKMAGGHEQRVGTRNIYKPLEASKGKTQSKTKQRILPTASRKNTTHILTLAR